MKCKLSYTNDNGKIVEEEFYVPDEEDDIGFTNKLLAENELLKKKLEEKSDSNEERLYIPADKVNEILDNLHKAQKNVQENFIDHPPFNSSFYEGYVDGISYVEKVLKEALKPKAAPEIVGEWIPSNPETDTLECSKCGYNIISEELKTPYCPWCGAKMKNWEE